MLKLVQLVQTVDMYLCHNLYVHSTTLVDVVFTLLISDITPVCYIIVSPCVDYVGV